MSYASNGFRRWVALAVLLACTGTACGGTAPASYPATIQEGRSAAEEMLGLGMGSALAIALVDRDHVVWSEGFGLTDREAATAATSATLFSIASASKTLAAVVVMRLVDRGLVDLDAPLVRYAPRSPAWSARMGGQWLVVNVSPDSVTWPQAEPRLRLAEIPGLAGRIAVLPRGGSPTVLDPSGDERLARTRQPGGRSGTGRSGRATAASCTAP